MDFVQVESKYKELKGEYDAGAITEAEFKAQLEELMIEDEEGQWWIIGYETGQWYYHDGEKWVQSEPPRVAERRRGQVEALYQKGTTALAAEDWGVAIEKFEAALALEPGHPEVSAQLAEAKARAEEARRLETRREPETPPAAPARRSWLWVVVVVVGLILLAVLWNVISGPKIFWADRNVIAPGECTILRWKVPNVEAVRLYGPGFDANILVTPSGECAEVCLEETTTFELKNPDWEVIKTVVIEVRE